MRVRDISILNPNPGVFSSASVCVAMTRSWKGGSSGLRDARIIDIPGTYSGDLREP